MQNVVHCDGISCDTCTLSVGGTHVSAIYYHLLPHTSYPTIRSSFTVYKSNRNIISPAVVTAIPIDVIIEEISTMAFISRTVVVWPT